MSVRGVTFLACVVLTLGALTTTAVTRGGDRDLLTPVNAVPLTSLPQPAPRQRPAGAGTPSSTTVPRVDPAWVAEVSGRTGIPEPAVRAYADATLGAPDACHLGWTTLAAIGDIESQHGTIGGRTVSADGRPSPPVLGPALDGHGDVARIAVSRTGRRWHGDRRWEHAVGPMQFLPGTWTTWARDGDGDGVSDPQDLDDAAAAAAAYLCAGGDDLRTGPGWRAAVFSYNHSRTYVDEVYTRALALS